MSFPSGPLSAALGLLAGRLDPPAAPALDGAAALVLGSDAPGERRTLRVGAYLEAQQRADWTDGAPALLRVRARWRGTRGAQPDAAWRLSVLLDGAERADWPLSSGDGAGDGSRSGELSDVALPLLGLAADGSAVALRLSLLGGATGEVDAELPAAALDGLVLDPSTDVVLVNRRPYPGQTNVAAGGPGSFAQDLGIRVELHAPSLAAPGAGWAASSDMSLWVNDVLAWTSGGGDEPGFAAAVTDLDGGRTVRLEVVLDDPLPANSLVSVRLEATLPDARHLHEAWTFETEDLLQPALLSAQARDALTVRATATEDLLAADPAGANDALNPANWTVLLLSTSLDDGLPAVTPLALSVVRVSGAVFDVVLDREMTAGALYALAAGPISDLAFSGNLMGPPGNQAEFTGYAPERPERRRFDLIDMVPDMNVAEDETTDLRKFIACLQEVVDVVLLPAVDRFPDILDPDLAPRPFLQLMLRDLGNPFTFALTEVDERRLVRVLVPIYQQKGTDDGIVNAVRFFVGVEVEIVVPAFEDVWVLGASELGAETWLGSSDLYDRLSFWVKSPVALTPEQRDRITKIVVYMKRAETHFRDFIEPAPPPAVPDHWELGLSLLGVETTLH